MTTPRYQLPYPGLGDVPNVPNDLEKLAVAVDAALASVDPSLAPYIDGSATTVAVPANVWTLVPLTWSDPRGGAAPDGPAADVPSGLYLCAVRLYPAPNAAASFWQARIGTALVSEYDAGGGAVHANQTHWNSATALVPRNTGQTALWLLSSVARNINYPSLTLVRLGEKP